MRSLVLICIVLLFPASVFAQNSVAENTPELCHDGVDNDGDRVVDCGDPDCAPVPGCASQAIPVYAPTPFTPVPVRPRRRSPGLIVLGAVAIPVGLIFALVSIPFWADGLDLLPNSTPGTSASDVRDIVTATALTVVGLGLFVGGIGMIASGSSRRGPRTASHRPHFEWAPVVNVGDHSGAVGIVARF